MKTKLLLCFIAIILAGCGLLPQSPETQIQRGALAHEAASNTATNLLRGGKMTVPQAQSYSGILHTTSDALDKTNKALLDCRAATLSTAASSPDPCKVNIQGDLDTFVKILTDIESNLKAKEKQ